MESNKRREMGQNSFTEDLIIEIISRVPTKSLLRFSFVSKSWRSLICTDPYFSHVQRVTLPDRPCLFIRNVIYPTSSGFYYHFLIDLESVENQSIQVREIHKPIHNPFVHDDKYPRNDAYVSASCRDFLVLLQGHSSHKRIAVSNPITGKHVIVPPNPAGDHKVVYFGFGYDRVHDCYKLLTRVKRCDCRLELMVYDLDKGTWKRLQSGMWWKSQLKNRYSGCSYANWDICPAKYVDGGVYWCFKVLGMMRVMVCFLLAEEEFHVVKPPGLGKVTKCYPNSMTVFDGKLCLTCQGLNTKLEFWSIGMDRDKDGERQWRWTKLLAISDVPPYLNDDDSLTPVCFSACKNKILILSSEENQLFWYDIVKEEFSKLNNPIRGRCEEGKLFWYDMVKKEVHTLDEPIAGRSYGWFKIF